MRAHCLTRIYAAIARNRLAAGDVSAADKALELGLAMSERHGNCTTCDALILPAAISVRIAQGAMESAAEYSKRLDTAAKQYGSRIWHGMASQSRAELEAAAGNLADALVSYQNAHQDYLAAGNLYQAALCLAAVAEISNMLGGPDHKESALKAKSKAYQILSQIGLEIPLKFPLGSHPQSP
jgi:ATP/maltotriose-dependent transcriptional regulator MalT